MPHEIETIQLLSYQYKTTGQRNKLPNKYSESIDISTIWRWKNEDDENYLGIELSKINLLEKSPFPFESQLHYCILKGYLSIFTLSDTQ